MALPLERRARFDLAATGRAATTLDRPLIRRGHDETMARQFARDLCDVDRPSGGSRPARALAREGVMRVERALEERKKLQASKAARKEKYGARASTSDPEARVMRMADNAYRPALDMQ